MLPRLALALAVSTGLFAQCDCIAVPAKEARRASEVVFRGTVDGFSGSGAERIVIFRVTRVWKGQVGPVFEMFGLEGVSLCFTWWPSLLKIGNELVVYASRLPSRTGTTTDYFPMRCKTALARDALDIRELGRGRRPHAK